MLNILKGKLPEELYNQVSEALKGEELDKYIPKTRFDEVIGERDALKTKVESFADYEELKTERDELKGKIETYADYDELKVKAEKLDGYSDYDEVKSKYDGLVAENKKLVLSNMGYDETFIDYSISKIEVSEDKDFKTSATEFLESNPKFKSENFQTISSSYNGGGNIKKPEDMDTEEYLAWREKHNVDGTEK